MNPFSQRSSIPSSILTSVIGWVGFIFIGTLIFGFKVPAKDLFLIGMSCAIIQVLVMRLGFFILQMHRHILIGAFWGLLLAIFLYYRVIVFYPEFNEEQLKWLIIFTYIGAPVGAFLSYFYIDDQKILAESSEQDTTNFGRDAHWLEPFGFGALAYLFSFLPIGHFDLTINVFIVGAMSGVFAAGASHFSPDQWKKSIGVIVLLVIVVGAIQGAASGLLFRAYSNELALSFYTHGAIAGILTYAMTFIRGRMLASKEEKGEF